jgi:serine/threonine protein kinase
VVPHAIHVSRSATAAAPGTPAGLDCAAVSTTPGQDPLIGRRFGSYIVSRKLGEGGMGAVYELVHPQIGKKQALKVLHAEYAKKSSIVDRFFAEAKSVVTIGHPNIVDITDYATLEDGTAYIIMEFLEGQSLAGYVKQRGAMSPMELAAIVLPICDALGAAHAQGIVHRDLKPENVHLVPRPDNPRYVKVLDFGIAKLATPDAAAGPMTKTGQVMGTPTYMSPEQAMGRTREIDHRTDIYALGVLMYQLLTGEVPFQAESFGDLMLMHLSSPPPPLHLRRPDLPPAWDAILQRALAKNREERFGSMREIADAIRAALGSGVYAAQPSQPMMVPTVAMPSAAHSYPPQGQPSQPSWPPASGESTPVTAPPAPRRSAALLIALLVIGVATAIAVALIVTGGGKKPEAIATTAPATIDAAPAPIATPPLPDAAEPSEAPIAEAAPPDAAPIAATVSKDADKDHHHHGDKDKHPAPLPDTGERGKIRVTAVPWGNVFVDGKSYGQTPQMIEVPAGRSVKVKVVNPELNAEKTETVVVDAGTLKPVRFNFTGSE